MTVLANEALNTDLPLGGSAEGDRAASELHQSSLCKGISGLVELARR